MDLKRTNGKEHIKEEIVYEYRLRVPKTRIAPLIGTNGETKRELSWISKSRIDVNSDEGDVVISGNDPIMLFELREVITAIGRGFNPEVAKLLFKKDYVLEIINIKDFVNTKKGMIRVRARVIGEDGKARKTIEELTDTNICIFGKTVGIIGEIFNVMDAKKSIVSLLNGSRHGSVYSWLEKRRDERNRERETEAEEFEFEDEKEKEFVRKN
ncbi:MAG: ribosomal assembly protein [Candidatus Woesearchaeota archaeon]|nr:ribosomal assembly protein [Candidatus Woesearchaeota archaeon]